MSSFKLFDFLGHLHYERNPNNPPILDSHTLKYLIERLDVNEYYQISRWELVARSIVKGYELRADKNFKLDLDYPLEQQLIINKDKIDDFAKWFLSK
jgi:sensor domain CHASE-containing protein